MTYISIIVNDIADAPANMAAICKAYQQVVDRATIKGNELLISVPNSGYGFSLNQLKALLPITAQVDLFDVDADGNQSRWWYCL